MNYIKKFFLNVYENCNKQLLPALILSFALSFMLYFYAPIEMYIANCNEFWFDIYDIFPALLLGLIIATLSKFIFFVAIFLTNQFLYKLIFAFFSALFICLYIHGNFWTSNLPALDGSTIVWSKYGTESVVSFIVCLVVVIGIFFWAKKIHFSKFAKIVSLGSLCSLAIFTCVIIVEIMFNKNIFQKKIQYWSDSNNLFKFSSEDNFIILLLDALDSSTFMTLLDNNPSYNTILKDFTYYPDTMAGYPFTEFSIPFILSGEWYENDEPFDEYQNAVFSNSILFEMLESQGYEISLYDKDAIPQNDLSLRFPNIKYGKSKLSSFSDYLQIQYSLVGFRYAPWFAKRQFNIDVNKFNMLENMPSKNTQFDWQTHVFYTSMLEQEVKTEEKKHFKFIHLEGAHVPYRYDEWVHVIENGTYEGNVAACITVIGRYLDILKEAGIYDNSTIIIMSDHGYNADGGAEGRQNPFFAIKGKEERKETLEVSNNSFSYEDLPVVYHDLLEGKKTSEISILTSPQEEPRRFLFYYYLEENHMYEYIQTGKASDLDTLIPTGNEFIR